MKRNTLMDILSENRYKTDKHTDHHHVQEFYQPTFEKIQYQKLNILEIGIWNGESLKLWHDFFTQSDIYGADHFVRTSEQQVRANLLGYNRIRGMRKLDTTEEKIKFDVQMDIIIDDGAHSPEAQIKTYHNSIHLLKEGGLYIIEDFREPFSSSTKMVMDAIPEMKLVPIKHKNEFLGVINK